MRKPSSIETGKPIRFSGRLDEALYRRAARLAMRGVLPLGFVWALVIGAFGVGLFLAFVHGQVAAGALATSLGLLGASALGLHELAARRAWRGHRLAHEPFEGTIGEDALRVESEHGRTEIPWDRFHQWKATRALLLVYHSPRLYQIVAAGFFATPDDWRAARALVARKVPGSQRGDRRRLLWIFLTFFVLFLAGTLAWTAWRTP